MHRGCNTEKKLEILNRSVEDKHSNEGLIDLILRDIIKPSLEMFTIGTVSVVNITILK